MLKTESVLENEAYKILWNFEIQTDHLIPARRPDLVLIIKKKACLRINMYLSHYRELRKLVKHEGYGDTYFKRDTWNGFQGLGKGIEAVGNRRKNRDRSNYSIIEIGQNTKTSPVDLKRLSVNLVND